MPATLQRNCWPVHNFSDFNIKAKANTFVGDKIPVKKILNLPITVLAFKIEPSKQKAGTKLLTIQIEKSGEKRVVFTGSNILIDQLERLPKEALPFVTTIRADNDYYEFT